MNKSIEVMVGYSDLFGGTKKKDREDIIKMVNQLPLCSSFILLSQFSANKISEKTIKQFFKNYYEAFISHRELPNGLSKQEIKDAMSSLDSKIKKGVLYSHQTILQLWKWLLVYGDSNKLLQLQEPISNLNRLTYLSLLTNDYLYEEGNSILSELFSNGVFNNEEEIMHSIVRTKLIYMDIAQRKEIYNEKEYLDINKDFFDINGYTLNEHLAVIFGLMSLFMNSFEIGEESWIKNINDAFKKTKMESKSKEIVSSLLIDYPTVKDWAEHEMNSYWNFLEFRRKPLFEIENGHFFPFSLKLLQQQLFEGLFHKVRHCYTEADKRFLSFYGRPFEKYVQILGAESIESSRLPYDLIPEFRYKKTKDSPDLLIKLNNKLLAIEVKSYRLSFPSTAKADTDSIKRDTNKMIIRPLKQLHDRIKELKELNHNSMDGVDEIYCMVVTQGHFPTLRPFEEEIDRELKSYFNIPIKNYYHLDIEEFEMLCSLIEREKPIFRILETKSNDVFRYQSFKNFLFYSHQPVRTPKYLGKHYHKTINDIGSTFFENFTWEPSKKKKLKRNKK
ncbi:MAG TPA: hypothetical protein VNM69_02265 [Bacillus sp. (in: firmicutes)]|nr:hypothetical protein [Bacillus sp. (in: firmicutes)]